MKSLPRVDERVSRGLLTTVVLAGVCALVFSACKDSSSPSERASHGDRASRANLVSANGDTPVSIEFFAPDNGDAAGVASVGWFVDLAVEFPGDLKSTGFVSNQLTGPGVHNNAPPFPGNFGLGKDDKFGGLVVLISTTTVGAKSCQNLADAFNLTGPTNLQSDGTEIWDTWIIGAPVFGSNTRSTIWAAEVKDLNDDGIYNDAPSVVPDANHDGRCTGADLRALGLASEIEAREFTIN